MDSDLYTALVDDKIHVLMGKDWLQIRDQRTPANNTVLHIACQYGSMKCVEVILQLAEESLLLQINSRGETALHLAVIRGHNDAVKALIIKAKSWIPLPQPNNLINRSSMTVLQNLIRAPNVDFETALHVAVRYNHENVVELLVEEDPSYSYPPNKFDETPLYMAALLGKDEVMRIILENCESPKFGGPHGRTALHAALMSGSYRSGACTNLLLSKKEDLIKVADVNGWTAFHYAAHNNSTKVLEFLLSVDKSVAYLADKKYRRTPLHVASYKGHCDVLKELLKYLPDAWESVDGNGQNIFHIAIKQRQKHVISYILSENLEGNLSNQRDNEGNTPLHLIVKFEYYFPELQDWMLNADRNADWNAVNDTNLTASEVFYQKCKGILIDEELVGMKVVDRVHVRRKLIGWVLCEGPKQDDPVETPKEMIMRYRQMASSHMIVAALITTVALTAGFAMPGGFDGNQGPYQGSPLLVRKKAFKTFMVADTVALVFSISSLFLYFLTSFKIGTGVIFNFLITAIVFNVASIAAMMVAFIAGTYAVLSHSKGLAITVCIISSLFLLLVSFFCFIPLMRLLRTIKGILRVIFWDDMSYFRENKGVWNV